MNTHPPCGTRFADTERGPTRLSALQHLEMDDVSRFLVTGGSGFLGGAVVRRLATVGRVAIYDLTEPDQELATCVDYLQGDIRDEARLRKAIDGCDAVFHLAAKLGVSQCQEDEVMVGAINGGGAELLCNIIRDTDTIRTVVAISSSEVYGEGGTRFLQEDDELQPVTVYGRSKLAVEVHFRALAEERQRQIVVIRPFNIYGPHQRRDFVVPRFCSAAVANQSITIFGAGQQTRTFTYIDDAVAGIIGAYHYSLHAGSEFEIFNIASRESVTIRTLAEMVKYIGGSSATFTTRSFNDLETKRDISQEIIHRRPSIAKAESTFGYSPMIPLTEGIRKTLSWTRGESMH
jgi:UDP-glucose 4-epimerase